jgi:hypothetical protein
MLGFRCDSSEFPAEAKLTAPRNAKFGKDRGPLTLDEVGAVLKLDNCCL